MKDFYIDQSRVASYIHDFCRKYDYPAEAEEAFVLAYKTVCEHNDEYEIFLSQIEGYYENYDKDYTPIFEEQKKMANNMGIHPYTFRMLYLIILTHHLHELYVDRGYSEDMYDSSVLDLKWKLFECKENYDVWGIFVEWWTITFLTLKRFGMGRLQFNLKPCPYDYCDGELKVCVNDEVVDIHIPSSGPLDREEYLKSYKRAEEFFGHLFGDKPVVFSCNSWLLSPNNVKFLPETSRILTFANDFRIVFAKDDPKNSNSWRIFNTMKQYSNPDDYPQNNKVQKAVVSWLKKGNNIGQAYGLMFYKNGKII